jgi:hypothetical protein
MSNIKISDLHSIDSDNLPLVSLTEEEMSSIQGGIGSPSPSHILALWQKSGRWICTDGESVWPCNGPGKN